MEEKEKCNCNCSHNCEYKYDGLFSGSQGWVCPKCGRVFSPMTHECWYCNQGKNVVGTSEITFQKQKEA